jgi:excisionase family DNA binding protein
MAMTSGEFEESFLTVAEVADLLRLNQQTVRNWIDAGSLPALRVGRRVRIKRSDLNRILESGYRGTALPASTIIGPSATDFWSGEPVGAVESASRESEAQAPSTVDDDADARPAPPQTKAGEEPSPPQPDTGEPA